LGLCFGHQEIAKHYGAKVVYGGRQWGKADLHLTGEHRLFAGLGPVEQVWMSHNDSVAEIGPGFRELGYSTTADGSPDHRYAAIGSDLLKRYGFQFHAEVDDTINGDRMLANFVFEICNCRRSWTMEGYLEEQLARIRSQVGDRSVFLLASGGVDSTVSAALIGRAIGPEHLHMLHIDNGLMRKNESQRVLQMYHDLGLDQHLHFVNASSVFLGALAGVVDPEHKRLIIGDTFIGVFQREAERLGVENYLLGQGTIYPDTIETGGTRRADTIKTHHNRVPIIEQMIAEKRVIEPLADLYKVEVRELGERAGIPEQLLKRHPFPGPGLGVRLLCCDGSGSYDGPKEELMALGRRFDLDVLPLPIRSVGVKADLRAYEHPVLLSGRSSWETLLEATSVITAEVSGINRCVWNLDPQTPSRARPLYATVTEERLVLLREADHLVMEALRRHGLYHEIWQCPTVLVPVALDEGDGELVVLRPVRSERGMTASPVALPEALLEELRQSVLALPGVSGLALDVTSKPPATIEWE
jgi:GMP synthase (glutamine-hydrolysing)